jgi:hypothetical protein
MIHTEDKWRLSLYTTHDKKNYTYRINWSN